MRLYYSQKFKLKAAHSQSPPGHGQTPPLLPSPPPPRRVSSVPIFGHIPFRVQFLSEGQRNAFLRKKGLIWRTPGAQKAAFLRRIGDVIADDNMLVKYPVCLLPCTKQSIGKEVIGM
ncbi:uncharacterized protein LOC124460337 [Drosophila willistoni]|uniref:uncharacterized protein LOC124460337 n=1 Tax=Drosophila willistoni TaxID=7260 RepID=UPI001F077F6F|nr:uncharacterized protein LOC124460337 [Drosophila willistoni]